MTITSERADLKDPSWTVLSVVHKDVPIGSPGTNIQVSIAYMCLLIVPIKSKAFKDGDTQTVYDIAEFIVNQYIKLYKLIPYVHHHDLTARNNTQSGLMAPVWKYEIAPAVRLVGGESLLLNMGPATLLTNQHPLTPQQQSLFLSGFTKDDWSEFHSVLYRLIKAYDFNCYGDADSSIVFSSSSIEGFFMTVELLIRVREQGQDYETALRQVRNKSLAQLVTTAKSLYDLNTDTSSARSAYGKWHHRCYKQRNNIIHKQDLYSPSHSRPAIDASANLILHIARRVRCKYSKSTSIMRIIEGVALGLLSKE